MNPQIKSASGGEVMTFSAFSVVSALLVGGYAIEAVAAEKQYGPGVTDTEIKIGQSVPYSGPASAFSSYGRIMTGFSRC
jgi:branched-chain amino acid transport system substrate-binding protein